MLGKHVEEPLHIDQNEGLPVIYFSVAGGNICMRKLDSEQGI